MLTGVPDPDYQKENEQENFNIFSKTLHGGCG
jgi:hypothetical protein